VDTEIEEQTGTAWEKRCGLQHGSIREFVESKPHLFDVRDGLVSVVEGATWDQPSQASARVQSHTPPAAPAPSAWGSADAGGGKSWAQRAAKKEPIECAEKCWFDFNDANITPVSVKELDKYWEGSECAYVLFYRRKIPDASGSYPGNASKAVVPDVPAHMQHEIENFNQQVQDSRRIHAEKMSMVKVTCYTPAALHYDGIALRPAQHGRSFEVMLDRRLNLMQAKQTCMNEMHAQGFGGDEAEFHAGPHALALHALRECVPPSVKGAQDGAMHVYEFVEPDHDESAPLGTHLKPGLRLLLWNPMAGVAQVWRNTRGFEVGPQHEAILLLVSYFKPLAPAREPCASPAASPGPEPKGVWGAGGTSAVGVVSGVASAVVEETDGPPPEAMRMLVRKDWPLGNLRQWLGKELLNRYDVLKGACLEGSEVLIHRLDRAKPLMPKQPQGLDAADDVKTLGQLQLKEAMGCWLAVEVAPKAMPIWQEPRAFQAFKWTQDGFVRVYIEMAVPESSNVMSIHVDVKWNMTLADIKKRATQQLKTQVKKMNSAGHEAIAHAAAGKGSGPGVEGSAPMGTTKGVKKEQRLVLIGPGWGEQGFAVTDETFTLRDIYQPDDFHEADPPPLPGSIKARLVLAAPSASSATAMPEPQTGSITIYTALAEDGMRAAANPVQVQLQREMLVAEARQAMATALKLESASEYHMRKTNWNREPADDVCEDPSMTFGAVVSSMHIKENELIVLDKGSPRPQIPAGSVQVSVWHHKPTNRSTLLAECDDKLRSGRPDGQVTYPSALDLRVRFSAPLRGLLTPGSFLVSIAHAPLSPCAPHILLFSLTSYPTMPTGLPSSFILTSAYTPSPLSPGASSLSILSSSPPIPCLPTRSASRTTWGTLSFRKRRPSTTCVCECGSCTTNGSCRRAPTPNRCRLTPSSSGPATNTVKALSAPSQAQACTPCKSPLNALTLPTTDVQLVGADVQTYIRSV
jgi:hypothetical protein